MLNYLSALLLSMILIMSVSCNRSEDVLDPASDEKINFIALPHFEDLSDSVLSAYHEDAARLALREHQESTPVAQQNISIDEETVQVYLSGLLSIYISGSSSECDTVTRIFSLHSFPNPVMHELILGVDSSVSWLAAWENGQRLTGDQEMDALLETYQLTPDRISAGPHNYSVVLRSEDAINIEALGLKFSTLDSVRYAEPNGYSGGGSDITAQRGSADIRYTFSVGWGDCPAGCIYRRFWKFSVNSDGSVQFLGSSGNELPADLSELFY